MSASSDYCNKSEPFEHHASKVEQKLCIDEMAEAKGEAEAAGSPGLFVKLDRIGELA